MCPHGLPADVELARDVVLLESLGKETQNLHLSLAQLRCHPRHDWNSAAIEAPQARKEHIRRDRLGEVVIGAEEQGRDDVERLGPVAGDEDDGEAVAELRAKLMTDLIAAETGQRDLDDDSPRQLVPCDRHGLLSCNGLEVALLGDARAGARTVSTCPR